MSEPNDITKKPKKVYKDVSQPPPMKDINDTSNWDNRVFKAPDGTLVIETNETVDGKKIITE